LWSLPGNLLALSLQGLYGELSKLLEWFY